MHVHKHSSSWMHAYTHRGRSPYSSARMGPHDLYPHAGDGMDRCVCVHVCVFLQCVIACMCECICSACPHAMTFKRVRFARCVMQQQNRLKHIPGAANFILYLYKHAQNTCTLLWALNAPSAHAQAQTYTRIQSYTIHNVQYTNTTRAHTPSHGPTTPPQPLTPSLCT